MGALILVDVDWRDDPGWLTAASLDRAGDDLGARVGVDVDGSNDVWLVVVLVAVPVCCVELAR